jgi:hypothetical protein
VSVIPSQIKGFINELSDLLSADDADFQSPPIVVNTYQNGSTDPLAGKPNVAELKAEIDAATKPSGILSSVQQTLSGAASSVSSAVSSLTSKLTGGTTSSGAKAASSTGGGSSWLVWVLVAGGGVLLYLGLAGGKGKKSFFGKLGGKSSIKLR